MVKVRAMVLSLALFPMAADAQGVPRPVPVPVSGGQATGISVMGAAQQRVPVRGVRFIAYARGAEDEHGVLQAMRAAGITDATVGSPSGGLVSGNVAILRGAIPEVTKAKLDAVAGAAAAYVRDHPGTAIDNVRFFALSEDCVKLEGTVRVAALAEARRRAEAIAAATGVTLGQVIRVAEAGGCVPDSEMVGGAPVDAATLTTSLTVTESVTYEIAGTGGARRRPL